MSIIQQIQEKYAKLMAIIIAVALIIFIVMLAFENGGGLFRSGPTDVVGRVNGEAIDNRDFYSKVEQQENYMKSQPYGGGPASRFQAIEAVWGQEVNRLLLNAELKKLGMDISKKEMGDILYGANPPEDLKKSFTDSTGFFNAALAKQQIDNLLKNGDVNRKNQLNTYFNQLELQRLSDKYNSLLSNSINFPKWLIEKQNAENSQMARVSFVREVYSSIPDSTIKITDKEIDDYVSAHKDDEQFKQEESRSIEYVTFSALPSASDSAGAKQKLLDLKPQFDSTKEVKQFLASQGVTNYYDGYINGSEIRIQAKDSFLRIPVGSTYGPYLDGSSYSVAKMIGVRTQPDTVTVRHILIGLTERNPQTGEETPVRDSATAYKLADSIKTALGKGANFDSLCLKFSDDQGKFDRNSGQFTGGKYENVTAGRMVESFNDFIFGNPVGAKGLVNTQFGTHYIEILSQKGSSPAYNIAYVTQAIEVSNETDANANNEATLFAGDSRDQKSFDANVAKLKSKGINKMVQADITPNSYQLQVGMSRELVKNIYKADVGEVVQPEKIGDNYVVAIVTGAYKKGVKSASAARLFVEPVLRNRKKAEMLIKKVGTPATLEAAATAWGGKQIEVADSVRMEGAQNSAIGIEPKIIGAAFNPANKGKLTPPIPGQSGVFVVRVDDVIATPLGDANVIDQRKNKYQQAKAAGVYPQAALMEAADIKDDRSKIY